MTSEQSTNIDKGSVAKQRLPRGALVLAKEDPTRRVGQERERDISGWNGVGGISHEPVGVGNGLQVVGFVLDDCVLQPLFICGLV